MTTKRKTTKKASAPKKARAPKGKAEKTVKVKAEPKVKAPKVNENRIEVEEPKFSKTAHDGEKSGAFIKRMLETNALTTQEIVDAVKENFPGSKATSADVAFHRLALKKAGTELLLVRVNKDGQRYGLAA